LHRKLDVLDQRIRGKGEEIYENKVLLQAIIESFEGFIYVSSSDFKLKFVNQRLGLAIRTAVPDRICYEAIHGRTSPCPFCAMGTIQEGEVKRFEIQHPQNGRWYSVVNSPICHMDGSISLLALITDIHDRKLTEIAAQQQQERLEREKRRLIERIRDRHKLVNIVGKSLAIQEIYDQIIRTAATDATVIIYGEPGTGKELVARAIHELSERRGKPFVPIHCGAIPENLIESEFFGYKKGAFSGALMDKPGYLDFGNQGTLFLDEVGEISLNMQVKLLRVIEGGGYTPVGSSQVKHSDVRIIAATNRDLKELVQNKMIREDFYYRIHILPIHLPPLRDRKDDIPLLVNHFMSIHACKRNVPPIDSEMMARLMRYDWPGNVRELQSVVIRYCNQCHLDFLPSPKASPASSIKHSVDSSIHPTNTESLQEMLARYEKEVLSQVLHQHHWERNKAAISLGIDRKTLFNKMKRYGLHTS
jgi:transcriptional regulator with PAS, ATPase and Fis domain